MASTNQSPQYQQAEVKFLSAKTDEEKLVFLEEMIRECPKHKSSEKMLAQLKTRYKKLKEKIEKSKKSGKKSGKQGIKKEEMQAVIIGLTNSGKSTLLSMLTNASPKISQFPFTTRQPVIGMLPYSGTQIQLIEIPAIDSEFYNRGIVNTADTILVLINNLDQLSSIQKFLGNTLKKKIIVYNSKNPEENLRKIESTLKSKKHHFIILNLNSENNLGDLKENLFQSFGKIRIFTKPESGSKDKSKSDKPILLDKGATVQEVAEKIFHGLSKNIKEAFITGPSSKFPNQKTSLKHELKDLDVVEFKTR